MKLIAPLVALLLMSGFACAQPAPDAPPPPAEGGRPHMRMADRFAEANTTHDGKLTLAQAQAAGMRALVRHFDDIDSLHQGYLTLDEIRAFMRAHRHARGTEAPPSPQ